MGDDTMELWNTRVIFYAYTPFHLFSAAYYAMRVRWNTETIKCLIWYKYNQYTFDIDFLRPYFDDIIIVSDPGLSVLPIREVKRSIDGGYLFRWSKVGRYILANKHENVLVCFSDQNEFVISVINMLKKHANNIVCMVEEGNATYELHRSERPPLYSLIARTLFGFKKGGFIGHTGMVDSWVVRHPSLLPEEKSAAAVVIRQNNIFLDEEWLDQLKFLWSNRISDIGQYKDKRVILWIGGPLEAVGIKNEEELLWFKEIVDAIQNDYVVLIKLHPRENVEKFAGLVDHPAVQIVGDDLQWIPLEFLVGAIHPEIILTVSSSAAFHIYEMGFQGKVIYTHDRFDGIQIDRRVFRRYTQHANIYDVKDTDELKHVIYEVEVLPREHMPNTNADDDIRYFESLQKRMEQNDEQ